MKAAGMEVRNIFWLRTGTPCSLSCMSRTSCSSLSNTAGRWAMLLFAVAEASCCCCCWCWWWRADAFDVDGCDAAGGGGGRAVAPMGVPDEEQVLLEREVVEVTVQQEKELLAPPMLLPPPRTVEVVLAVPPVAALKPLLLLLAVEATRDMAAFCECGGGGPLELGCIPDSATDDDTECGGDGGAAGAAPATATGDRWFEGAAADGTAAGGRCLGTDDGETALADDSPWRAAPPPLKTAFETSATAARS